MADSGHTQLAPQPAYGDYLHLTHALAGQAQPQPDIFQRAPLASVDAETHFNHFAMTRRQLAQPPFDKRRNFLFARTITWIPGMCIAQAIEQDMPAVIVQRCIHGYRTFAYAAQFGNALDTETRTFGNLRTLRRARQLPAPIRVPRVWVDAPCVPD